MKKHSRSIAIAHGKHENKLYMNRYKEKSQFRSREEMRLANTVRDGWKEEEISQRRDKIIEALHREKEVSRMRIEDESMESQFYRDDYADLEIMWNKKIHEI